MEKRDSYLTLSSNTEGLYKEKGSKFLAFAYNVRDENEVKARLAALRKKYFDARHHCYAYVLGINGEKFRANDDGEPGHSAGDPILGQIRSHNLTNTLIVVVRYFGGRKLGVGGLIHAYKTAALEAIINNTIVSSMILNYIHIEFKYPDLDQVMRLVKYFDLQIIDQNLEMSCSMTLGVIASLEEAILNKLRDHKIRLISKN